METRLIIAGSRGFTDYQLAKQHLDSIAAGWEIAHVISGCARGADRLGERWAAERGIEVKRFPARWSEYGKRAGRIRNEMMAACATHLIAFWDEKSRGTKHMIETAREYGLDVTVVEVK
jgi:hypothetical protein